MRIGMFRELALGWLFLLGVTNAAAGEPIARHVFVVSMDGGKPAVAQVSPMPTLFKLVAEGSYSWQAQTIDPPITLPSHTSMVTGVGPEVHHVTWNSYKPENGAVKVPTMFSVARKNGFVTALFATKTKFNHLNIPGSLNHFAIEDLNGAGIAREAASYIVEEKPNLCFIHMMDPDNAGHSYGWGSPQQIKAFEKVDQGISILVKAINDAGIADDSVIIVTADHGGTGKGHETPSPENSTIPWIVWGKGVKKGHKLPAGIRTIDTAATALWVLGIEPPANWEGSEVSEAFEEAFVPAAVH